MSGLWEKHEEEIARYKALEKEFIENIKTMLRADLKEEGVKQLGNNCFTISSSKLFSGRSWSPEYFDSHKQIEAIIDKVDKKTTSEEVKRVLIEIYEAKCIKVSSTHKILINENVEKRLKEVLEIQ